MSCKFTLRQAILGVAASLVAGGGVLAIAAVTPRQWSVDRREPCDYVVYVSSDGFHTNFFVPVDTPVYHWREHLNLDKIGGTAAEYRYLQFGWGDRIFYMETPSWDQVSPLNALRALVFWRNSSALFVKGHATAPSNAQEAVKCLRLSKTNYLALMAYIHGAFQLDERGNEQRLGSGQDHQSSFYAAQGYYSALNTCNSWTAEGLRAAHVNTPVWAGLATPLINQVRNGCPCDG